AADFRRLGSRRSRAARARNGAASAQLPSPRLAEPAARHRTLRAAHQRTSGRAAPCRRFSAGTHIDQLRGPCVAPERAGTGRRRPAARSCFGETPMIEIARTYTFEAPQDRVWQLLMDTKALSSCIPGCESLDPDPDTQHLYRVRLAVKLAAVMGT